MSDFKRGKLTFRFDAPRVQLGTEEQIVIYNCFPPPQGTRQRFAPETTVVAEILPRFLQASERARLVQFAAKPGETLDIDTLLNEVMTAFGFMSLTVDLTKVPAEWQRVVPCEIASITYVVVYFVYQIDALASEDLTIGAETYPAGDLVASFRARNPGIYRFRRSLARNPHCCPTTEDLKPRPAGESQNFPEEEGFGLELKPDFKLMPSLELRPDYFRPRSAEEETEEERRELRERLLEELRRLRLRF